MINLKNILKKTSNKKSQTKKKKAVKKKTKIVRTKKIPKIKKVVKDIKTKKNTKNFRAKKTEKGQLKTEALRISKNNEQKPEIKKVKKQETEKKEYKVKDYVVYPKHGVGQITEFKKVNIGGIDVDTYILKFEKDKANGMVPVNKQSHLRAQEYEAKISSGKIYELAEVVRDLNKGDDLMIDQSYSERQLFEKAYDRLLSEFQIVIGGSLEDTQKKLDKALKRNLEKQIQKVEVKAESDNIPEEVVAE